MTVDGKELLRFFDWDSPQGKTDLGLFAVDCSGCFGNVRILEFPSVKPVVDGPTDTAAGYVCAVKGGQVRVDHGKGRVAKGQKLTLARCLKVVDDPKTRKPFAIKLQRLGEAEVTDVGVLTAGARIVSGKGIKVGDRALLDAPKEASWWRRESSSAQPRCRTGSRRWSVMATGCPAAIGILRSRPCATIRLARARVPWMR